MKVNFKFLLIFLIVLYKAIMYYPFVTDNMLYSLIIIIVFVTFIIMHKYKLTRNIWIKSLVVGYLVFLAICNTFSVNMLFPLLIGLTCYKDDYKKISKFFLYSLIICFLFTIILNYFGFLPDNDIGRRVNGEIIKRRSLGFIHPNFVGIYAFFIGISLYLSYENEKRNMLLYSLIMLYFFYLSNSRTALIAYIILLVGIFFENKLTEKGICKIVKYLFTIFTLINIILIVLYLKYDLKELNILLSGRLENYSAYAKAGLFTTLTGMDSISNYTIDNYFLYFFFDYGVIGYVFWTFINYISIKKMEENYKLMLAMLIMFVYGLMESNVVVSSINLLINIQIMYFLKSDENDVVEKEIK